MSAQHTPGPWTYHPDSGSSCAALIATGSFVCEFIEAPNEANARLIAAAPELLEALVRYVAIDKSEGCTDNNLYRSAVAAIAKVTGEQT